MFRLFSCVETPLGLPTNLFPILLKLADLTHYAAISDEWSNQMVLLSFIFTAGSSLLSAALQRPTAICFLASPEFSPREQGARSRAPSPSRRSESKAREEGWDSKSEIASWGNGARWEGAGAEKLHMRCGLYAGARGKEMRVSYVQHLFKSSRSSSHLKWREGREWMKISIGFSSYICVLSPKRR